MQTDLSQFDVEELLHLAIHHTGQQRLAEALACLKRAATLDPKNGAVLYFTSVIYAQTGLMERALTTMQRAVELDPSLDIAHFQIGLLLFGADRIAQATEAWKPLDRLGEDHPLFLFKTGLEALAQDDYAACRDHLTRGIERNTTNAPLNDDMRKILVRLDEQDAEDKNTPDPTPAELGIHIPTPPQTRVQAMQPVFRGRLS